MHEQRETSRNIIDRRHVVGGIVGAAVAAVLAIALGRSTLSPDPDAGLVQVTSTALDRGQAYWASALGAQWRDARVVLFTDRIATPCGEASALTGPFYCPPDEHVYLDLSFLRAIRGDLARAYVIAHELGHHVQNVRREMGAESVEVELEADCYAGHWMADERRRGNLDVGDVDGALAEAATVGDRGARETWTHGDAAHRRAALERGLADEPCTGLARP